MKKVLCILTLLCMVCTGAWAQIITSTPSNPVPYGLKDVSADSQTAFVASDLTVKNSGDQYGLFIFIETETTDYYKIYELKSQQYVHDKGNHEKGKSKTELITSESDATKWHIRLSETENRYLISPEGADDIHWNFHGGFGACASETMGYYNNATDAGSKWFLVRTPFIGVEATTIENGKYYSPYNVGRQKSLYEGYGNSDKQLLLTSSNNKIGNKLLPFFWKANASGEGYKFQNVGTDHWIGHMHFGTGTSTTVDSEASAEVFFPTLIGTSTNIFSVKTTSLYTDSGAGVNNAQVYWNGNGSDPATFCVWSNGSAPTASSNGAYKFFEVVGIEDIDFANVGYGYRITNEDDFGFSVVTHKQIVGYEANNELKITFDLPYYSDKTAPTESVMVSSEGTNVYGTCTSTIPFATNTFYAIHFRDGITTGERNGYLYWNGSQAKCRDLTVEKATEETTWWFKRIEGTPYFSMHNMAKGAEYGVTGGSSTAAVTMTETPSLLYPVANSTGTNGFQMVFSGSAYQLGDHKDGNLAIWADTRVNDQGSRMTIEDVTDAMATLLTSTIESVNSKVGTLGYPKSAPALANYITVNFANYFEAKAALTDVYTSTDIVLPEDGKAYTIKAVWQGGEDMLYYDESIEKIKGATNPTQGNVFVCKKTGEGKFLLVNEYGKYLTWGSSTSVNDVNASAVVGEYSKYADVTIAKATARTNGNGNDVTDEGRFGLVTLQAIKYGTDDLWYSNYIHGHDTNNFVESGSTNKWYDSNSSNRTHMFRIEEAEDYAVNKTTLKTPKVDDGKTYASIYLPYAVELPEGVIAYQVTSTSDASFHLEEIEGDGNLPKETGAILVGEAAEIKTLVPCAATPAVQENNKLDGCMTTTDVSSLGGSVYVLNGGQASGIGFFPLSSSASLSPYKAYYREESTSSVQGYSFNFDEAIVTAIQNISATGSHKTEVYDLQGRRMKHVQKGLNIVNGRKVIR